MADTTVKLPEGFVLDSEPNVPDGFVVDNQQSAPSGFVQGAQEPEISIDEIMRLNKAEKEHKYITDKSYLVSMNPTYFGRKEFQDNIENQKQKLEGEIALTNQKLSKYDPERQQLIRELAKKYEPGSIGDIKRQSGELIGATGGSIGAPALAASLGVTNPFLLGSIAVGGAILGGGGGNVIDQYRRTGSVSALPVEEAAKRQGVNEIVGRGIVTGFKLGAKGIYNTALSVTKKSVNPANVAMADDIAKQGVVMPPSFRNEGSWISFMEEMSRGSLGGDRIWNKLGSDNQKQIVDLITDSVIKYDNVLNSNTDDAGNAILNLFKRGGQKAGGKGIYIQEIDDFFGPKYEAIYNKTKLIPTTKTVMADEPIMAGGKQLLDSNGNPMTKQVAKTVKGFKSPVTLDITSVTNKAKKLLDEADYIMSLTKNAPDPYTAAQREVLETMATFKDPKKAPFEVARDYIRKWQETSAKIKGETKVDDTIFTEFSNDLKEILYDPTKVKGLGKKEMSELVNLNKLYSKTKYITENIFTKAGMGKLLSNPSLAVTSKAYFPNKSLQYIKENIHDVLVHDAQGNPNPIGQMAWEKIALAKIGDTFDKAITGRGGRLGIERTMDMDVLYGLQRDFGFDSWDFLLNSINPQAKKNIDMLSNLYTKSTGAGTKRAIEIASEKSIKYRAVGMQAAGAGMIAWGGKDILSGEADKNDYIKVAAGGMLLMGPITFAKLARTNEGAKALAEGFKMTAKTGVKTPALVRIVDELKRQESEEQKKLEKAIKKENMDTSIQRSRQAIYGGPGSFYGKD